MKSDPFNKYNLLGIAGSFAFLIGVPLIILILIGRWLDARQGTEYFVLLAIPISLAISSYAIYKRIKEIERNLRQPKE